MHAMKRTHGKNSSDNVCRLCSSNSGIIVLNIFDGEGKKRRVLSLINACLPVKVYENDPLPKVICHHCLHKLEVFHEFQESCLKSEETLRNCVSCSLTVPVLKSASREYVHEDEKPVPQFSTERNPVQDPLLPPQLATVVPTPAEEDTDDCIAAVRSDDFEHSLSSQVEVVVKEEPECKKTEPEDESRWLDTSQGEDNVMQTEEAEVDLLPHDDINSAICSTPIVPPVISKAQGSHAPDNTIPRLTERHFLGRVPCRGKKRKPQRRCAVCSKRGKRKETVYCCMECDVGLCMEDCFKAYHTKLNY